mgnify:CR=1 FL=1
MTLQPPIQVPVTSPPFFSARASSLRSANNPARAQLALPVAGSSGMPRGANHPCPQVEALIATGEQMHIRCHILRGKLLHAGDIGLCAFEDGAILDFNHQKWHAYRCLLWRI